MEIMKNNFLARDGTGDILNHLTIGNLEPGSKCWIIDQ